MNAFDIYNIWKEKVTDPSLRSELESIDGNENEIIARFTAPMSFGTAGLRSIMGAGISRMNIYTVAQATQGLAELIRQENAADKGVAIAHDSRNGCSPKYRQESLRQTESPYIFSIPCVRLPSFRLQYLNWGASRESTSLHHITLKNTTDTRYIGRTARSSRPNTLLLSAKRSPDAICFRFRWQTSATSIFM